LAGVLTTIRRDFTLTRGRGGGSSSSGLFLEEASMGEILSCGDPGSLMVCLTAKGDTHCYYY
jgi:hypothetical protein